MRRAHALAEMHRAAKPGGWWHHDRVPHRRRPDLEAPAVALQPEVAPTSSESVPGWTWWSRSTSCLARRRGRAGSRWPRRLRTRGSRLHEVPHIVLECEESCTLRGAVLPQERTPAPASAGAPALPPAGQRRVSSGGLPGVPGPRARRRGFVQYLKLIDGGMFDWADVVHSILGSEEFFRSHDTQRTEDRANTALHRARMTLFANIFRR